MSIAELPSDFNMLVDALVQVRAFPVAAVEVHDTRLSARLLHLRLADTSEKGLRGTETLEAILSRYDHEFLAKMLCTDLPELNDRPLLTSEELSVLATARSHREEITRLSRELQQMLQPLTDRLTAEANPDQLDEALAQFPAGLQRNALVARARELREKTTT